jgi:uroporphyrinogen decarboxylase
VDLENNIFMRALRREQVERTPVWLMRQAGRYQPEYRAIRAKMSFLELCHNSQVAAEVTTMAVDMLQVDAAIIFADILLPLQCLNAGLRFAQGDGPVIDNPIRLASDVERLSLFDIEEGLGYVFQSIKLFVKERPLVPLIGFAGAPFTLASYLIEGGSSRNFERTKAFMYQEPQAFARLMAILTDVTIAYLLAQVAAGAHCLMLFDSWVGTLSREDYESTVLPYSKKIFAALASAAPSIHFGTATGGMLDLIASAGSTVVGVDWRMDLASAWQMIGDKAVQGNLDPTVLLGDRALIKERTQLVLDKADGRPGHIFNLGHGIGKDTPVDNVKYLVDLVRELSSKSRG